MEECVFINNIKDYAMPCIYKIINTQTHDCYVGKTEGRAATRFKRHLQNAERGVDTHLYRAMRKYGPECFTVEVVEDITDKTVLNEMEVYYIDRLSPAYNMTIGGDGGSTTHNRMWVSDGVRDLYLLKDEPIPDGFWLGRSNCKFKNPDFQREMSSRVDRSKLDYKSISKKAIATRRSNGTQRDIAGENNPMCDPTIRAKISEIAKNRPQVTCPVCGKQGQSSPGMFRFHFNNCKYDSNKDSKD